MSRSNPNEHQTNPATRFMEWNGEQGNVRYYDKALKKNVDVPIPFTFLLLDELACVRGWNDASSSGIYSNEVRDTRTDLMVVKSFKGGTIAEGLYKDIKDRVNAAGGQFNANCYIGFKDGAALAIASLKFKGAALGAWMEFRKANRSDLYKKAIHINGFAEGKKGKVIFRVPTFELKATLEETDRQAVELDRQLQQFLDGYLSRRTEDKAEPHTDVVPADDFDQRGADDSSYDDWSASTPDESEIPF